MIAIPIWHGGAIWTMSIFGGTARKLKEGVRGASISYQGSEIAYIARDKHSLWVADANADNAQKIVDEKDETLEAVGWSPDGKRVAYIQGKLQTGSLRIVSVKGGTSTTVFSSPDVVHDEGSGPTSLWLADGRILFSRYEPEGHANLWISSCDVKAGKACSEPRQVTNW